MADGRLSSPDRGRSKILVSRRQTRFHNDETLGSKEVDIDGLSVAVATDVSAKQSKEKRSKAAAPGKEILVDAHLRLKSGQQYGLLGRNGTGKSTLLEAIVGRLIPGLPSSIKITALRQIDQTRRESTRDSVYPEESRRDDQAGPTALQFVTKCDTSRDRTLREFRFLSEAMNDPIEQVKAFRRITYEGMERELHESQKIANLRSGFRGYKARKNLTALEDKVAEAKARVEENLQDLDPSSLNHEMQAAADLLMSLQAQIEAIDVDNTEKAAREVLAGLGFKGRMMHEPYYRLSGGWQMRCQLAGVLIQDTDLMLLDEPTNFLDLSAIVWLEEYLQYIHEISNMTMLIISHDRQFIDNCCREVIILRDQSLAYFRGTLSEYEADFRSRQLYMSRMKEANERQTAHFEKTIAEHIRQGKKTGDDNRLRQAKSRKKRVEERSGMQVNEKGFKFKLSRDAGGLSGSSKRAEIIVPVDERSVTLSIPQAAELRFPGPLVSADNVSFKYTRSSDSFVLENLSLVIHKDDRIGILGLNGSGKTTLLRIIFGDLQPSKGSVTCHPRLKVGYYSQHAVDQLRADARADDSLTALGMLMSAAGDAMTEGDVRGLLGSFGLPGKVASDVPVAKLSGGQLVRLALVLILWKHPNLLILDEISTHLDFDTVNALEVALNEYNGAVLLVTHDRSMMKAIVEWQRPYDDEASETSETARAPGKVYVLRKKSLEQLEGGVEEFEERLKKTVNIARRQ